jgi:hypothetical protein
MSSNLFIQRDRSRSHSGPLENCQRQEPHTRVTSSIYYPGCIRYSWPIYSFQTLDWFPDADLVNPAETTLSALTLKNPQVEYIVLFGMPSSWSFSGFPIGNKENVVAGMANLSITNDEGSKKLNQAGGSNKPNGE